MDPSESYVKLMEELMDMVDKEREESYKTELVYRQALKTVRAALNKLEVFALNEDEERDEACQRINEVLEVFEI